MTPTAIIIIILEIAGLGISIYLISKNYKVKAPVCMIGHDCGAVLNSKYSRFLGLKMETYGLLYYVSSLSLFLSKFYFSEYSELITVAFGLLSLSGVIVSIILTFIQVHALLYFINNNNQKKKKSLAISPWTF
jgi:uncharacterized membrane protein